MSASRCLDVGCIECEPIGEALRDHLAIVAAIRNIAGREERARQDAGAALPRGPLVRHRRDGSVPTLRVSASGQIIARGHAPAVALVRAARPRVGRRRQLGHPQMP